MKSTGNYSENIKRLKEALDTAEAVVIGAGAGLSTAAGFTYSGERFKKYFADFIDKHGFADIYSGGFYPFETSEEHWACISAILSISSHAGFKILTLYIILLGKALHCFLHGYSRLAL